MRLLIMTDSSSMPRKYRDGVVEWEQVYPNLLRKRFPDIDIIHWGFGAAALTYIYKQVDFYEHTNPDIVIIHCGGADAAPRALTRLEVEFVKRFRLYRMVKPFFKFFRKHRGLTSTTPKEFKSTLIAFQNRFPNAKFFTVGILPGCKEYDEIVPGITASNSKFDQILKENSNHVDLTFIPKAAIIEDYHHVNAVGHQFIFQRIVEKIKDIVEPK